MVPFCGLNSNLNNRIHVARNNLTISGACSSGVAAAAATAATNVSQPAGPSSRLTTRSASDHTLALPAWRGRARNYTRLL